VWRVGLESRVKNTLKKFLGNLVEVKKTREVWDLLSHQTWWPEIEQLGHCFEAKINGILWYRVN
jgi:hypothetical protein